MFHNYSEATEQRDGEASIATFGGEVCVILSLLAIHALSIFQMLSSLQDFHNMTSRLLCMNCHFLDC